MKHFTGWVMALACAIGMFSSNAFAQRPPEVHPASERRDIVMSWDRSAMPGDIELWAPRTMLAYDHTDLSLQFGALHLVCNPGNGDTGRCPAGGQADSTAGLRSIPLSFVEERSQMRAELNVRAGLERALSGRSCLGNYWQNLILAPWSTHAVGCALDEPAGTGAQLSIASSELRKLVAGIWTAKLELHANVPNGSRLATYSFDFSLTVTDRNAVAVYLPEFDNATPSVGLDLRYNPFAQTIEGRKVVDMCLYDGLGSQSLYLGVTARDVGARAPGATGFSVWHRDGGRDERQRVDYTVALDHNGAAVPMSNGVEQQLQGIDSARLRLVILPGMNQPVFCVPTPMTLVTPRFPRTSKDAGYYEGQLQVELRVPTATP